MRNLTSTFAGGFAAIAVSLGGTACAAASSAAASAQLNAAELHAYASKPWDKKAKMHTTEELGRYQGTPVIAEYPCGDVCPQYTMRIIHFRLPAGTTCASVGGVEKEVLIPIAIAVRAKTVCVPEPLVASGQYYSK